ncbi:hypothetical protein WJX72_010968 [[Myrmecia] bisecta]|uniref:NAD(P)-binding protein n=1 Tax=[Myrmecia] bisecta TaxID=41462 RepID=A0AAW1QGG2_9CHLO
MGRFDGQVVLVTGGSGIIGSGVIQLFLEEGATVLAPGRSNKSVQTVHDDLKDLTYPAERLWAPVKDVGRPADLAALASEIKAKWGGLDHVVAISGGWWDKGGLLDISQADFLEELNARAGAHFNIAHAFIPLLKPSSQSSYTMVTGMAGERVIMKGASMITVCNAAQYGMALHYFAETADSPVRVNEIRIGALIKKHAALAVGHAVEGHLSGWKSNSNRVMAKVLADIILSGKKGEVVRVTQETLDAAS